MCLGPQHPDHNTALPKLDQCIVLVRHFEKLHNTFAIVLSCCQKFRRTIDGAIDPSIVNIVWHVTIWIGGMLADQDRMQQEARPNVTLQQATYFGT